MKPFRIFRPGKHVASCGTAVEFTEDDLKQAVSNYNAQVYAAPLVIGHPKTEDRAYGWAERLSYEDGHVVAHPDKVDPAFADLVEKGAYRNRSASWYMPDHPNNPVPGSLYPKHIGFLGAVPPALKGLGDIQFSAEDHPDQVVEFADTPDDAWALSSFMSSTARMLRGIRDNLLATKGADDAEKLVPSWTIEDMERQAMRQEEKARQADKGALPSFTDPTEDPKMTLSKEEAEKLTRERDEAQAKLKDFQERETALKAAEHMATVATIERDLDPMVKAGKLLPAQVKGVAAFMASLDNKDLVVEFGEPVDGVVPKVSNRAFMLEFIKGLPKAVDYNERAGNTRENSGALTPTQLAEKATALRAKVKSEQGIDISFSEATNRVLRESGVTVEDPSTTPQV